MTTAFEQLITFLADVGISPDRVGQIETESSCTYENDAPITYQDGGTIVIYPDGSVHADCQWVATMENTEDAFLQAKEIVSVWRA